MSKHQNLIQFCRVIKNNSETILCILRLTAALLDQISSCSFVYGETYRDYHDFHVYQKYG